ncbi:MAG: hypothetical protein J2P27_04270 [Actinobacteria bacterium]|nr:hypothetical protein [Actinomycetota bacterium]
MPKASNRNHRNNPYALDKMFATVHHSAAGALFRFRTELAVLVTTGAGFTALTYLVSIVQAALILLGLTLTVTVLPWPRRFIARRAWCVLSRHRIQRVCFETMMHTRSGRLPLVLRISPTQVGERAIVWCRAGICAEDFEGNAAEIAAACYAREVRVLGSKRWAQIVVLHIVRRDTLAAHHVIAPALASQPATQRDSGTAA